LRDIIDELKAHNTQLVAITPQLAEKSQEMIDKHKLQFDLLHDAGNDYMHQLGLRFKPTDEILEIYDGFGIDLPKANGEDSQTLPIPCRLIINQQGIVEVADIDPDYTRRPEPEKTLDDVKRLFAA